MSAARYPLKVLMKGVPPRRNEWCQRISVSQGIVCVCVTIFVAIAVADVTGICQRHTAFSIFGLSFYGVASRAFLFQFLTHPAIHADLTHLAFNMLALWMLGTHIERRLGPRTYVLLTLVSSLSGALAFILVDWGGHNIALGYSAVVFGLVVALVKLDPNQNLILLFWPVKAKYAAIVLAGMELYLIVAADNGGLAGVAHLFGALGAFILFWIRDWDSTGGRQRYIGHRKPRCLWNQVPFEL